MHSNTEAMISLKDAIKILRVSRPKMSRLIQRGLLKPVVNPLDNREKLVPKSEVEALIIKRAEV